MNKSALSICVKMIILLPTAAIIGILLLSAAYFLPTDRIKCNVGASVKQLSLEGDHYSIFYGLEFTNQDNYSDAIYMNQAMIDNRAKGFFTGLYGLEYENKNALIDYDSPVTLLNNIFIDGADLQYKKFSERFWNGYVVPIKLLLIFFTYGKIRYINGILELICLLVLCFLMYKKKYAQYIVPVIISFIFLGPITMAATMAFSGFLYCTYIPCIVMFLLNDRLQQKKNYPLFFMVIGICTAYFTANYFQIITFAYAFVFYCLLNGAPKSSKSVIMLFLMMLTSWIAGFCGMYIMKWIAYETFTGEAIISNMLRRTLYRISSTAYYTGPSISRLVALGRNFYYVLINAAWVVIEFCYVIWAVLGIKRSKTNFGLKKLLHTKSWIVVIFLLMTLLVIGRYLLFANHVYIHAWTTYRIADAMVFAFNVMLMNFTDEI